MKCAQASHKKKRHDAKNKKCQRPGHMLKSNNLNRFWGGSAVSSILCPNPKPTVDSIGGTNPQQVDTKARRTKDEKQEGPVVSLLIENHSSR